VPDPALLDADARGKLLAAFEPIGARRTLVVEEELQQDDRIAFDVQYLELLGLSRRDAQTTQVLLARELREAMAERRTRADSVAEQKAQRTPRKSASRAVDAFAARIVSSVPPYPDPRHHLGTPLLPEAISIAPFEGELQVGDGLFDSGKVFAGTEVIAETASADAASYVRAVLTIDPDTTVVDVPSAGELKAALEAWRSEVANWWDAFASVRDSVTADITDTRMRQEVSARALRMAHASELPESAAR
jgi:hypothetical protein